MFQINDSVVYETAGVCIVTDIRTQSYVKNKKQNYYVLDPVFKDAGNVTIMIPVDTKKKLRRVITKEEIQILIESMQDMETDWQENLSERTEMARQTLRDCDCAELANLMKTYYQRQEDLIAGGKKMAKVDKDSFTMLEKRFTQEIGYALGIDPDAVIAYIDQRHKQLT